MHFAHASARTGLSPLSPLSPELVQFSLVTTFTTYALTECFPIGALRDTWTWRDLFTGELLHVPLQERIQCLWMIHAQRTRDLKRARPLDPPIW